MKSKTSTAAWAVLLGSIGLIATNLSYALDGDASTNASMALMIEAVIAAAAAFGLFKAADNV